MGPGTGVSADTIAAPRVRRQRRIKAEHVRDYGIVVFAIALFVYFTIASSVFLTKSNLLNLVSQNATIGVAACAVTLTIIAGNFDLSLGSIFVLAEVLAAYVAVHMGSGVGVPHRAPVRRGDGRHQRPAGDEAAHQRIPRHARVGSHLRRHRGRSDTRGTC